MDDQGKKPPEKTKTIGFAGFNEPSTSSSTSNKKVVMPAKFIIPHGTKLEDICTQCTIPLTNKVDGAFKCGFCFRFTHVSCTKGNYTVNEIKRIKYGDFFFRFLYVRSASPKKEPINVMIDVALPWQKLTSVENKLEKMEKVLEGQRKKSNWQNMINRRQSANWSSKNW